MSGNYYELSSKLFELSKAHSELSLQHWLHYEFLTWQWWGKIIYLIIPIILLYKVLDRKRALEIVSYGLIISLMSTIIDTIGVSFLLWEYPIRLLPTGFFAVHDLVVIPITTMLVYQFFPSWKSYIIINTILSAIGAFIVEPIYMILKVYHPINWPHRYSFLLYIVMVIICKLIIDKLKTSHKIIL